MSHKRKMISEEVLKAYGAETKVFEKEEIIFSEKQVATMFFQISTGEVKLSSYSEDGKEFIQGIFSAGRSFGEPPLFGDFTYPVNAIAMEKSHLLCLGKTAFLKLLLENSEVHIEMTKALANRLYYKTIMASEMSIHQASHRILTLLDYLKNDIYKLPEPFSYEVELTRQQIGDLSGLRVETVIRTMKKLKEQGEIRISNRKVYR